MIYLNVLTFLLLFSKCFGADNDDDDFNSHIRDLQDQPIYSRNNSPQWVNPPESDNHNYGFGDFNLWEHTQQIPPQHPQTSLHQQSIYNQPPHHSHQQFPTIPSQGESSSNPNLQNNPNEIENENQKYLLVTQEMINQREKEKEEYNAIEYKKPELINMKKLINNIQLDPGVQLNKSKIDQGFSLNSNEITGDHIYYVKTRIYKCFKYTYNRVEKDTFYLACKEGTKKCKGRMTFKNPRDLTNNFYENHKHTCKTNGSFEHEMNICVTPGVTNKKELSYCIYIEYNINAHSERITNFVGTQEIGTLNDCKEQKFKTEGNIENIQFIVVWSENIFFGKDDVLYESRFDVKNEEFVPNGTIILDINNVGNSKLDYYRETVY